MSVLNEDRSGSFRFRAESFHVDFKGDLLLNVLGNELLNCADAHANACNFGLTRLNDLCYTWVLSRLVIEMKRMPRQHEEFIITTWVENAYRLFTNRNFEIRSADGEVLGYARSIWAMIEMNTRKPIDLFSLHGNKFNDYLCAKECPIERPGRIKVSAEEPVEQHRILYSDIDINGHVNSVKYMEHLLNLFPLDYIKTHRLHRFEIAYSAESYFGDTLSFFEEKKGDGECYEIEIRKSDGEAACRSKIEFLDLIN
jgi:acyl-ACP thioesterase